MSKVGRPSPKYYQRVQSRFRGTKTVISILKVTAYDQVEAINLSTLEHYKGKSMGSLPYKLLPSNYSEWKKAYNKVLKKNKTENKTLNY